MDWLFGPAPNPFPDLSPFKNTISKPRSLKAKNYETLMPAPEVGHHADQGSRQADPQELCADQDEQCTTGGGSERGGVGESSQRAAAGGGGLGFESESYQRF